MSKKNIALLLLGVNNENCGGAERFFADLFRIYQDSAVASNRLFLFTDPSSAEVLQKIGKLHHHANLVMLKNVNNRFKRLIEKFDFRRKLRKHRIDVVHVTSYGRNYYDRLASIRAGGPKITLSIVDCEVPYILGDPNHPRHKGYSAKYLPLFKDIHISGVFSWYRLFNEFAREKKLLPGTVILESATSRFADTTGFVPAAEKRKEIVFAARLTDQKKPLMFLESVRVLRDEYPALIAGWKFLLFGKGALEEAVKEYIRAHELGAWVMLDAAHDMKPVFAYSKCFVSTQDYENFPSLAMNEAMASGNCIIARNVGQTALFVKDGVNGYLAKEDTARGVAMAIKEYISNEKDHFRMQQESIRLTKEVHTPGNFILQADAFWEKVAKI